MTFALDSTGLQHVAMTTLADVNELINKSYTSTAHDDLINDAIDYVSDQFTRFLGYHTLQAARTETYELGHGKRVLTLDGRPVVGSLDSLKVASHPDNIATASEVESLDYVLHADAGWIKFQRRMANWNYYAAVQYTGGLATDAADLKTDFPELAMVATLQVKHLVERRDTIGGNIETMHGAKTRFRSAYQMLPEARHVLDSMRRGGV